MCGHGSRAGFTGRRPLEKLCESEPFALADWLAGGCANLPLLRVATVLQRLGIWPRMELSAMWV